MGCIFTGADAEGAQRKSAGLCRAQNRKDNIEWETHYRY